MSTLLATVVPHWVWQATTIATASLTAALLAILGLHVVITAVAAPTEEPSVRPPLLRRLTFAAIPMLVCLAVAVAARFVIIFLERPGP